MVDLRNLHGRRVVVPKEDVMIPQNKDGFVELGGDSSAVVSSESEDKESPGTMFNFMDNPAASSGVSSGGSSSDIRKLTERIERLDNTIYKLEQRIELLERKVGVNSGVGEAGW